MAVILSAQIVHELRNVPRGTVSEETILLMETAYKLSTSLEDVLKAVSKSRLVAA